jgi:hypothetical protein
MRAPRREDTLNRVFLMGYRFDILAYPVDRTDPSMNYLKELIALRQKIKAQLYGSDFRDEIGLGPIPEKVYAKIFRHRQGKSLTVTLVDRRAPRRRPFKLTVNPSLHDVAAVNKATLYQFGGAAHPLTVNEQGKRLVLEIPVLTSDAAAIVIGLES